MEVAPTLLEQLPNGGAVVAIIVVVVLCFRRVKESEDTLKQLVATFVTEAKDSRKEYREHITEIMNMGLEAHKETREAIRSLGKPEPKRSA